MATAPKPVPRYEGSAEYRGPSMAYLMQTHTLADQIIATHPLKPANILDTSELALLRMFVADPSKKEDLLRQSNMLDNDPEAPGEKARVKHGSLVGYCVANDKFDAREISLLKEWFDSGALDEELKGVKPSGVQ